MIAATYPSNHSEISDQHASPTNWQRSMAEAITDPETLLDILQLDRSWLAAARRAAELFPLRVPRGFVDRMKAGDPNDPLLRQVMPLGLELAHQDGFVTDPVGDMASRAAPGVLHKYSGRALLMTTGACGIHCRYCFRRHFPYAEQSITRRQWLESLQYLRDDQSIAEVILSGGDPLSLSNGRLVELTDALADIQHIRRLRIHTRQPVVLPERVDAGLCQWLRSIGKTVVVVVHANHAQEIDHFVRDACMRLRDSGATLLNQSVLLRGINDSVTALVDLSESLLAAGVLPYYLHLLDRVRGAGHFEVQESAAKQLMSQLTMRLPGYLVPRLVRESPGELSKTIIPF